MHKLRIEKIHKITFGNMFGLKNWKFLNLLHFFIK